MNAGAVSREDLARLREVAPSQGMMVESLRPDLAAHRGAPDKTPERRLATLEAAGELAIPFTTGILVGIGETEADRLEALEAIAREPPPARPRAGGDRPELPAQARHRHARRSRRARPRTTSAPSRWLGWCCRPTSTSRRRPTSPTPAGWATCSTPGIDDWGGVSPVTIDHVNPERPWPAVDALRDGDRGARAGPRAAADRLPRVRTPDAAARAGSTRPCGSRCSTAPTPSRSAATTRAPPGPSATRPPPTSAPAPRSSRSAAARPPGTPAPTPTPRPAPHRFVCGSPRLLTLGLADESGWGRRRRGAGRRTRGPGGRRGEIVTLFARPRARGRGRRGGWPTSCGARRSATRSPTSSTATSTTPTCARSGARSAGSPRARCRSTCAGRRTC